MRVSAVIVHWPPVNAALAQVAFGSKITVVSGTVRVKLLEVIF